MKDLQTELAFKTDRVLDEGAADARERSDGVDRQHAYLLALNLAGDDRVCRDLAGREAGGDSGRR